MRRAFSLIVAIFFVVLVSGIALISLDLSSTNLRQTTSTYLYEQAELLAQGATEHAVARLLRSDFSAGCPDPIGAGYGFDGNFAPPDGVGKIFDIRVRYKFFGNIGACTGTALTTKESQGSVIIDVWVKFNPNQTLNADDEENDEAANFPVTFHKRTLQKL